MSEKSDLYTLHRAAAVMLAYALSPCRFPKSTDAVFFHIVATSTRECRSEVQISRAQFIADLGLSSASVSSALSNLLKHGVISRKRPRGKTAYSYSLNL